MSEVFARKEELERRKSALAERIQELEQTVERARAAAAIAETDTARVEHADGFSDWFSQGWIGGMFSPILVMVIVAVVALGQCASGGCDLDAPQRWSGSVIATTDPRAPLAARCDLAIHDLGDECDVEFTCGEDRQRIASERVRCQEVDVGTGDDTSYMLFGANAADTLAFDERTGTARVGPKGAPELAIVVHDFFAEPPEAE